MESTAPDWVSETRFGKWFLSTDMWYREVLSVAVTELRELGGARVPASFDRLMDVGCGQGRTFQLLRQLYAPREIVAVDIDPLMLERARAEAARCEIPVTVKACSVTQLDLPDNSVDGVLCHQLIHHVANQAGALRELHRVLAPGGFLFLSESCRAFIDVWTVRWFFRHPPGAQRSAEEFQALVREAGFEFDPVRDVRTSTPWWSLWDFGFTRNIGLVKAPPEATELLLVARKGAGSGNRDNSPGS
jgi:SAM-dependent methyltransferase